jgi:magnesium-transporting ATPase (P-type)
MAAALVPGDIVQISLGSVVPADLRLLTREVLLDQSMLTGESIPVEAAAGKTAYAGGLGRRGEAIGEVVKTGARTYFGRAAELVRIAHVDSSEQRAVLNVVRNLTILNFAIVIAMASYAHASGMGAERIIPLLLTALLAAVPVALPATFTLAATLGAKTLALKGVLLTRLTALHEAAMIDVLCADKTGTLTANTLAVAEVCPVSDGYSQDDVVALAALASSPDGQDPIDTAIRRLARAKRASRDSLTLLRFIPFDPTTKMAEAIGVDHAENPVTHRQGCARRGRRGGASCTAGRRGTRASQRSRSSYSRSRLRTAGPLAAHRPHRLQRSTARRFDAPVGRAARAWGTSDHGIRRCRGDSRSGGAGDRTAGRSLPARQDFRRRRPR